MPRVPTYGVPEVSPNAQFSFQRTEDQLGAAFGAVGARLEKLGEVVHARNEQMAEENARTEAAGADADQVRVQQELWYNEQGTGYSSLEGKAAVDALPTYMQEGEERAATIAGGLSPRAQKLFAESSRVRLNQMYGTFSAQAVHARDEWTQKTALGRIEAVTSDSINFWNDDKRRELALGVIDDTVRTTLGRGQSEDWINNEVHMRQSALLKGIAVAQATTDPRGAMTFLEANRSRMTGEDVTNVEAALHTRIENIDQTDEAMSAYNGVGGVNTNVPLAQIWPRQVRQESGGRQLRRDGTPVVSSAGAVGISQTIESTARMSAQQLGIPFDRERWQKDSAYNEALGKQHMNWLLQRYNNNTVMALAAYNAGWGVVDDWTNGTNNSGKNASHRNLGDPRKGLVSAQAWAAALPFAETRQYVKNILGTISPEQQAVDPSTGAQRAWDIARQSHPNDNQYALGVVREYKQIVNTFAQNQAAVQKAAEQALIQRATSQDRPRTRDEALNSPALVQAYNDSPQSVRNAFEYAVQQNGAVPGKQPAGGGVILGDSEHDKAAYNDFYEAMVPTWNQMKPEQALQLKVAYAAQGGRIPTSLRTELRGQLRNASPQAQVAAAASIRTLTNANPRMADDFSDDEIAQANAISDLVTGGFSAEDAAKLAMANARVSKLDRDDRLHRFDTQYRQEGTTQTQRGMAMTTAWDESLQTAFGDQSGLSSDVDTPGFQTMRNQFMNAARQQFVSTDNVNAASAGALANIRRTWRLTDVNGKPEYMLMAPEIYYGIHPTDQASDTTWIREQLDADVGRLMPPIQKPGTSLSTTPLTIGLLGVVVPPSSEKPYDHAVLIPAAGQLNAEGKPAYFVSTIDSDGGEHMLRYKDGITPVLWWPNQRAQVSVVRGEEAVAASDNIDDARAQRERSRSMIERHYFLRGGY